MTVVLVTVATTLCVSMQLPAENQEHETKSKRTKQKPAKYVVS